MSIFLENPGIGRKYRFHGAFGSKAAAERKEASLDGGFIRETVIRGAPRYVVLTPKRRAPTGSTGRSTRNISGGSMARRSRSKRRKRSARRNSPARRASAVRMNPPRRRGRRRAGARRNAPRHHRRRGFRRNPPGIVDQLTTGLMDGAFVTGGALGQNLIVRNIPDIMPPTMSGAAMLNGLVKDIVVIGLGSFLAHKALNGDRARFVVAGQAYSAYARQIRAANIPTVSTLLGEYDPIRLSGYTRGIPMPRVQRRLPSATPKNVKTLGDFGVYTDGMSSAPSLY